jgi:hypothetical protein
LVEHVERFTTDRSALERFYPPVATVERARRLEEFHAAEAASLEALAFEELGLDGRVDWVLLRAEIENRGFWLAEERTRLKRLAEFLPFAEPIAALEEARGRVEPLDPAEAAATLAELARGIKALAKRVARTGSESAPAESLFVSAGDALWLAARVDEVLQTLAGWYRHYDPYLPGFTWWCAEPKARLIEALEAYAKHLRETVAEQKGDDGDPLVGDPIGRAALEAELAHEFLSYSPEELLAIGERELRWCEAELRRAAAELGHGDDWRAALAEVKEDSVPPGEQDELVASIAREMIAWLDERELVTIPSLCREVWRVRMIPREDQRLYPFAFYGGQTVDVAYPTADMEHDAKLAALRGNNVHFTRAVTPHELIPGHHLQGFYEERENPHRSAFRTPFLTEGWALYWEMLEYERGWARTPKERIGMLFWRMHRAARIQVSLSFHLAQMTPAEMIDFLVERVGHERENATAEVRRYIGGSYGPLYQCAYLIGGLQLSALRRELVDQGGMPERAFHDALLAAGPIPIELLRCLLKGTPPSREARASWRFDRGS